MTSNSNDAGNRPLSEIYERVLKDEFHFSNLISSRVNRKVSDIDWIGYDEYRFITSPFYVIVLDERSVFQLKAHTMNSNGIEFVKLLSNSPKHDLASVIFKQKLQSMLGSPFYIFVKIMDEPSEQTVLIQKGFQFPNMQMTLGYERGISNSLPKIDTINLRKCYYEITKNVRSLKPFMYESASDSFKNIKKVERDGYCTWDTFVPYERTSETEILAMSNLGAGDQSSSNKAFTDKIKKKLISEKEKITNAILEFQIEFHEKTLNLLEFTRICENASDLNLANRLRKDSRKLDDILDEVIKVLELDEAQEGKE